jgi:lipopolysaccharide transport system ATP-binding protein
MKPTVISIENITKRYRLGAIGSSTIARDIALWTAKLRGKDDPSSRIFKHLQNSERDNIFVALDDVSIEIKQGDTVALIGKNGAGKSTLLKVLSRITPPTSGTIKVQGRMSSLLEVGTGFHQDLTGRENIFLNGAILGMPKKEIREKLDEIIAFSGVERHIDTPVKRYSSGMYVRLAFAVAAHLEPEIMVVDEVLAVGDADFQKKCLGKMNEVAGHGRTVIFVSHQMSSVKALCNRGIYLKSGKVVYDGNIDSAIAQYLDSSVSTAQSVNIAERKRDGECTLECQIIDFKVHNDGKENSNFLDTSKPVRIELHINADEDGRRCGIQIRCNDGLQDLIMADSPQLHGQIFRFNKGINIVSCEIAPMNLYKGDYHFDLMLYLPKQGILDNIKDIYDFSVNELDPYHSGFSLERNAGKGIFHVDHRFSEGTYDGPSALHQEVDPIAQIGLE